MDIEGGNCRRNGLKIILWDAHGNWNQKFKMLENGDGSVTFANERFAIDACGGRANNFTQIQLYERNGTRAQKFFIRHRGNGWFSIHSSVDQNYCIDIHGANPNNGTKVQLYQNNGSNAQKFKFVE